MFPCWAGWWPRHQGRKATNPAVRRAKISGKNLIEAESNAAKGKRKRREVVEFEKELYPNLLQIQAELLTHTYKTSEYSVFVKYEPKRREIYKLPYRDRVVQWAPAPA